VLDQLDHPGDGRDVFESHDGAPAENLFDFDVRAAQRLSDPVAAILGLLREHLLALLGGRRAVTVDRLLLALLDLLGTELGSLAARFARGSLGLVGLALMLAFFTVAAR